MASCIEEFITVDNDKADQYLNKMKTLAKFDRSGWLKGIGLLGLEMKASVAQDPPTDLTLAQQVKWGGTLVSCIIKFQAQGRTDVVKRCLDATKLYEYERSGWINAIKSFDLELMAKYTCEPPVTLSILNRVEWTNVLVDCLQKYR